MYSQGPDMYPGSSVSIQQAMCLNSMKVSKQPDQSMALMTTKNDI